VLTTDQKGSLAEAEVACAAMKLGIGVYRPLSDGERYDLIFDWDGRLVRVQCKWAPQHGDVIVVRCRRARRTRHGLLHRSYVPSEIDAFAAYCAEVDRCYFLPIEEFPYQSQIQLRLGLTQNNQQLLINWARDFEFEAKLGRSGAVAQLGERRAGSA
jgi:hypothetical protein